MWRLALCCLAALASTVGAGAAARTQVQPARCPAKAHENGVRPNSWAPAQTTLAPPGAVSMRLCRYTGLNGHPRPGKLARARLLSNRARVTKLVDEFDQLQPFPPGVAACPMDDGSFILALLAYPDGHRVRIEVDTTGCRLVSNGDVVRTASGFGTTAGPKLEHQLGRLTA